MLAGTENEAGETTSAYLICNFNRANLNDAPPYEINMVPASGCSHGRDFIYDFLCRSAESVDNNFIPRKRTYEDLPKPNNTDHFITDLVKVS